MASPLPYTLEPISEEEKALRKKLYTAPSTVMVDMLVAQPGNFYMPKSFERIAQSSYNLKVKKGDVFIDTYPKAGSTWCQEMIWQIMHGFDPEEGKKNIFMRSPFLEFSMFSKGNMAAVPAVTKDGDFSQFMAAMMSDSVGHLDLYESPRLIKTHLPVEMLPKDALENSKIIWIARNPKDTIVSFFNHEKIMPPHGYTGSFEDQIDLFLGGKVVYGDYWTHLKSAWKIKDHPNVLIVWYEDLKKDLPGQIRRMSDFLGANFPESKMDALCHHLSFDQFKNNPAVNHKPPKGACPDEVRDNFNFIRKGIAGDWKNHLKGEILERFEAWIEKNNVDPKIPMAFDEEK